MTDANMPIALTTEQLTQLQALGSAGNYPAAYALLRDALSLAPSLSCR